jgi:hypothetical protein
LFIKLPLQLKVDVIRIDPLTNIVFFDGPVQQLELIGGGIDSISNNNSSSSNSMTSRRKSSLKRTGPFAADYSSSHGDPFSNIGAAHVAKSHCRTKWSRQRHLEDPYLLMDI